MDGAHLKITGSIYGNFPLSIYGQAKGTVRLDVNYGMDDSQHEDKEYGIKVDNLTIQGGGLVALYPNSRTVIDNYGIYINKIYVSLINTFR